MNQAEAEIVGAEVVALQAVLIAVLRRLAQDRPDLSPLLCQSFEEAEAILTGVAVRVGLDAPLASTVGALRVVEEIRDAVIHDPATCGGAAVAGTLAHDQPELS